MSFPDRFDHNNRHSSYDLENLRIAFDDWNEKSNSELLEDKATVRPRMVPVAAAHRECAR
ncbi:hypothetical protein EV130_101775 [Rhizobium azibense]|uniref:Uncharacterized protein n=1 Tax=Rhizobium azibense TaxID=1136135 RepID=A0A4R3R7J1_9HYPH|nr:hypothetical protein EV130_101775 [Rhizobium azibense]